MKVEVSDAEVKHSGETSDHFSPISLDISLVFMFDSMKFRRVARIKILNMDRAVHISLDIANYCEDRLVSERFFKLYRNVNCDISVFVMSKLNLEIRDL